VMWPAMSDSLTGSRSSQWHLFTEGRDVAGDIVVQSYSFQNMGNDVKFRHEEKGQYFFFYKICLFTALVFIGYYDIHFGKCESFWVKTPVLSKRGETFT